VCTTVDGGERAVIFDRFRGILPEVEGEGTHFRVPWVQTPHVMDIRTRPRTISSVTGTKGGACCVCVRRRCSGRGVAAAAAAARLLRALSPTPTPPNTSPPPPSPSSRRSTDLQMVNMSLRLLSKPDGDKLSTIFKVCARARVWWCAAVWCCARRLRPHGCTCLRRACLPLLRSIHPPPQPPTRSTVPPPLPGPPPPPPPHTHTQHTHTHTHARPHPRRA
jgi:hypothetical protein